MILNYDSNVYKILSLTTIQNKMHGMVGFLMYYTIYFSIFQRRDVPSLVVFCMAVLWCLKMGLWHFSAVILDSICLVPHFSTAKEKPGMALNLSARV